MRKKREFIDGSFYHVTSRTNDKIRAAIAAKESKMALLLGLLRDLRYVEVREPEQPPSDDVYAGIPYFFNSFFLI